ncbi:MAG: guanylate kinase [Clostridiales bacterium]|nr:guanylate kinase [Clostridiales bacterium]MDY5513966.1 guanylate kinase [Candidatus Ventricola sp.]
MGKMGVLFVFSGPSGVGKGTLKKRLLEEFKGQIVDSVSATTREPRKDEQDGREYFFISRQEFDRRVENNDFLEHAEFSGNCYGTPRENVMNLLNRGIDVVLEIDVQGARQVREKMSDCVSIFILPPSFEELEHRLRERHTETEEKILERLETARREIPCAPEYDYQIVNNDLDAAYDQLRSVYVHAAQRA